MRPVSADGDHAVVDPVAAGPVLVGTVAQLFAGLSLAGLGEPPQCVACGCVMTAGRSSVVAIYRPVEQARWQLGRCYCQRCAPESIETPTLGVMELQVTGRVETQSAVHTQSHAYCLLKPGVQAVSLPERSLYRSRCRRDG